MKLEQIGSDPLFEKIDPVNDHLTLEFEIIRDKRMRIGENVLTAVQRYEENEEGLVIASFEVFEADEPLKAITPISIVGVGTWVRFVTSEKPVQVVKDIEGVSHPYIVENRDGKSKTHPDTKRTRRRLARHGKQVINSFSASGLVHA